VIDWVSLKQCVNVATDCLLVLRPPRLPVSVFRQNHMVQQHIKARMETRRDREQQVRQRRQGMCSPVVDRRKRSQRKKRSGVHGPRSLAARSDQPSELLHSPCYIYSSRACLVCSISPSRTCSFCSPLSLCLYVCLRAVFALVVSFYPIPWCSMTASSARHRRGLVI